MEENLDVSVGDFVTAHIVELRDGELKEILVGLYKVIYIGERGDILVRARNGETRRYTKFGIGVGSVRGTIRKTNLIYREIKEDKKEKREKEKQRRSEEKKELEQLEIEELNTSGFKNLAEYMAFKMANNDWNFSDNPFTKKRGNKNNVKSYAKKIRITD